MQSLLKLATMWLRKTLLKLMLHLGLGISGISAADSSPGNAGASGHVPPAPGENTITLSAVDTAIPKTQAVPARATLDTIRLVDTIVALSTDNPSAEIITPQTIIAGQLYVEFFVSNPSGPAGDAVLSGTSDLVVNNTLTFQLGE